MSNSSQVSDGDGKMDIQAKDSFDASPPVIHDGASVNGLSTVSQGRSGKFPSRECDMDSDSSVHTLDLDAFCESELSCSYSWLLHS